MALCGSRGVELAVLLSEDELDLAFFFGTKTDVGFGAFPAAAAATPFLPSCSESDEKRSPESRFATDLFLAN